ncbi:MAG: RIP metalloprotease RseP [Desulfosalsimonadaceae bacterium]
MSSVIGLIIVLGVLIFFHELGHFIMARAFGVGVEKFSLGFGPALVKWKKGRTEYCISAFPLGGFVKMVGEQPDAALSEEDRPYSFTHKPVSRRMIIVAAGPVFNFLLAIIIFFVLFTAAGLMFLQPEIGEVRPDSPAARAGLEAGDRIVSIGGTAIESWSEMAEAVSKSGGNPVEMQIEREGREIQATVNPVVEPMENIFGETHDRYIIGITASGSTGVIRLGPVEAVGESLRRTYMIVELTVVSVAKMVRGTVSVDNLGGPIMIAQMAGEQVEHGLINLLGFIALVSINLGILNLLPIPVLDGGHLMFFGIEAVKGSPVSLRTREVAQQVGLFILLTLIVFVFYNDIMRIVTGTSF